jgi:hypothetical protein
VDGGDLPNNAEVHIRVVVGDDVAHPSHLSERQCGNLAPGFLAQVGCGFSDNFDAPDHGILFLRIGPESRLGGVLDVRRDEARRLQNIAQPAK